MAYIYDLTDTWNAGGTTFNAIKMNVTDSASAAGSKLVTLQTNGTEHFSVTKAGVGYFSGNVGIGTSSVKAGYKLDIAGSANASGSFVSGGGTFNQTTVGNKTLLFYNTGSGEGVIQSADDTSTFTSMGISKDVLRFATQNAERMRIDSSGNVGIGVTPSHALDVYSAANGVIRVGGGNATNQGAAYYVKNANNSNAQAAFGDRARIFGGTPDQFVSIFTSALPLTFDVNGSERMRIDSSGNVGIGTTTPASTSGKNLTIGGIEPSLVLNATDGRSFSIASGNNYQYAPSTLSFIDNTAAATRMVIDSSGNLLWGKSSTANELTTDGAILYKNASGGGSTAYFTNGGSGTAMAVGVQADANAIQFFRSGSSVGSISLTTTATSYNTSSDYRLKDIDGPITNSGAYIDALKPVQGSWKADGSRFIGLLAHEVQEVSETLIATGEKDGEEMQAMDYSAPEIIANLIAEIQSLRARVAQLEGN